MSKMSGYGVEKVGGKFENGFSKGLASMEYCQKQYAARLRRALPCYLPMP